MPFTNDIAGGNGSLVRNQLQSPNFAAGSAGWIIRKDGTAEFNNGTFRGNLQVGVSPNARFIVNDPNPPGNYLDVYDNSNNLILALLNPSGQLQSYSAPGTQGNPVATLFGGQLNVSGTHGLGGIQYTEPNVFGGSSQTEVDVFINPNSGQTNQLSMKGGSSDGTQVPSMVGHNANVFGNMLQTDGTSSGQQLVKAGLYSGLVAGGDGHFVFAHGCSRTPKVALISPYAAGGGDGPGYVRMWTNAIDGTFCYTIWTNDGGARTADGSTVGVHAIFIE